MSIVRFPYGKEFVELDIPNDRLQGVLVSRIHDCPVEKGQTELVLEALDNPIGTPRLRDLARGKHNVVIIASDHTRPVPSKAIIPPMLEEIRKGSPDAKITILISTGCHRGTTKHELIDKFGPDIVENETIYIHDCDETEKLVNIGTLPSGGELIINKLAYDADLLVSEGFIEPHFFAGYSGARKSVLPGIASRTTVLANHCSEFIANPRARTGILDGNPLHKDMVWAARKAKLAFIVNVVINAQKETIFAVAGDMEQAHAAGCDFLSDLCKVSAVRSDIVITSNGGYPLDQNIYQAVKGMTAAEGAVKKGGVIIMVARSNDGHGGQGFYKQLADQPDINITLQEFLSRGRNETTPDQWQVQVLIRVLQHASVIYVSEVAHDIIEDLHMIPADNLQDALNKAEEILGNPKATITAIPDGVSVMVIPN
ncbi:MAG: nickel-dependent lactate racemase [Oscillospiraceae bacterium]|nr:nickel-dependent lactate racemase [Oscillospiraceae bacterium]